MKKSLIKIIDPGLLESIMGYVQNVDSSDFITLFKTVRISMITETNRLQSLFLCELLGSYSIQSQRYCRYDEDIDKNVIFENMDLFESDEQLMIKASLKNTTNLYLKMTELNEGSENKTKFTKDDFKHGIPIDDGRYILPMAYSCNAEMTLNGEEFLKLINLFNTNRYIFGDLYEQLMAELTDIIGGEAVPYISNLATFMLMSKRTVNKSFFDNLFPIRSDYKYVHLLGNECKYTPMQKSAAGALICTTSDKSTIEILDGCNDEVKAKQLTERVVVGTNHTSVSEHASFSLLLKQSIPCYNQYVRHRHQETIREDFDVPFISENGLSMVLPASIMSSKFMGDWYTTLSKLTATIKYLYTNTLEMGDSELAVAKKEARLEAIKQLIPMGYEIRVICTTNLINETYKATKRLCNKAHWEIGIITRMSIDLIKKEIGEDNKILDKCRPGCCTERGCSEGKFTCGDNSNVLELFNIKG